jgi:hypothetical protein
MNKKEKNATNFGKLVFESFLFINDIHLISVFNFHEI